VVWIKTTLSNLIQNQFSKTKQAITSNPRPEVMTRQWWSAILTS